MKTLLLIDNIPALAMLIPIISELDGEVVCIDYNRKANQSNLVKDYLKETGAAVRLDRLDGYGMKSIARLLDKESPDVVVLTREEATPIEKGFNHLCRQKGISNLLIPHGVLFPNEVMLWGLGGRFFRVKHTYRLFKQGVIMLFKGCYPLPYMINAALFRMRNDYHDKVTLSRYDTYDKVAAYGEGMKQVLLLYNVKSENIVITGNPKYDILHHNNSTEECDAVLLITNYLVEFGTWTKQQRETYLLDVYEAVKAADKTLLLKIHPVMENAGDYLKISHKHELSFVFLQFQPLANVIHQCDIGITTMSSGGVEVMAAGKPLVIYNPFNDVTQYSEKNGSYVARNRTELTNVLADVIKNGMNKEKRELASEYVYYQTYKQDGRAGERIVSLIEEMGGN